MPHDPDIATRLGPKGPRSWQAQRVRGECGNLRLKDRIKPGVRVLFVGINPGVRSALTGHHFAGFSNRFWKLLFESGLVPEPITFEQDDRLPEFGFGITNLIPRPSPGINDLVPSEYVEGWKTLDRKIRRYGPKVVALVGVTLYRAIEPLLAAEVDRKTRAAMRSRPIALGPQPAVIHGAQVFVLPNPSGRNANFTYAEMLAAFTALRTMVNARPPARVRADGASTVRAARATKR
jgi:TDG/mug DNA glycosylase family protein